LQLIKETESILDAEKKKLEEKQHKTQQEIEAHVDLKIIYKLVDGGNDAWENIPILLANDKQRYTKQASNLVVNNGNEILEHQIKEKDKELGSLRGDKQPLQMGNSTVQQQIARNDSKINSLQSENQEQKLRIISLEYQLKEKDKKINSLQSKTNEMELLRQNMERQLADEKTRNEVLERENRVLKQERAPDQTNTQSTSRLNNDTINPTNAESNHGGDDDNAHNDINYDSEYDATEESDNDENNDINYDTPSEDEKT
jgi:hypothetical protein